MNRVDEDRGLAVWLRDEVAGWQNNSARSKQATLGPSQLGGCREFIRATVAGDPGLPETGFKSAAFMGTAVGDMIERVFVERCDAITQREITTYLHRTNVTVAGSADFIIPPKFVDLPDTNLRLLIESGLLVDVKSKDGLAETERYGTTLEYMIQLSTYLVGAVQEGLLDDTAHACLLFVDRSGVDRHFDTITIDYDEAVRWVDLAEERLMDVQDVINRGSTDEDRWALRDKPPSWCFAIECPFRTACWSGSEHLPTGEISHEIEVDAVTRYVTARDDEKAAASRKAAANRDLAGITGITADGTKVTWTNTGRTDPNGDPVLRLDVRVTR